MLYLPALSTLYAYQTEKVIYEYLEPSSVKLSAKNIQTIGYGIRTRAGRTIQHNPIQYVVAFVAENLF